MRGIGYNLEGGKVVLDKVTSFKAKCKKEGSFGSSIHEPISVLDARRSPSSFTSTSTLSSSFDGGGGGADNNNSAGVVVISENTLNHKWPISVPEEADNEPDGGRKDEWATELQPISAVEHGSCQRFGLGIGLEDWESLLSESAAQDQSLLRWISGDVDDNPLSLKQLLQAGNVNEIDDSSALEPWGKAITSLNPVSSSGFCLNQNNNNNGKISSALAPNSCVLNNNRNPQNPNLPLPQQHQFASQIMLNQPQQFQSTANFDMSSALFLCNNTQQDQYQFEPQLKRHNPGIANFSTHVTKVPFDPASEFLPSELQPQLGLASQLKLLPPHHQLLQKPIVVPKQEVPGNGRDRIAAAQQQQQQVINDQLYKVAELILAGNFSHAQAILARLNHQLSPNTKPFQRASFYFKEALQMALMMSNPVSPLPPRIPTPVDGMFKMGAYKVLSEVSPLIQFMNFTSNQALLEALGDADSIHIIDFDIGFGVQWSSFLQELPRRDRGAPLLKITAFASPTTHHPIELGLMHENLTQFANEIGVSFELEVVNLDSFDPNSYSMPPRSSENEAIAVNFPIWSSLRHMPSLPSILCFIKQLSPKIMVSMDRGCERTDLPFPQHLLHALQYYEILLDSIDAANVTSDAVNKIERFLFQPSIESMVLGRLHFPDQMLPWKSLFASLGFSPMVFSNFAETQADCVVKRTQVRGFRVEKRQASLVLCWQHHELMSASAWRC